MKNIIIISASILLMLANLYAQGIKRLNPFTGIGKNSLESFSGSNLFFHGAGILSTYILITSGADYKIHNYFVENGYSRVFDPAVGVGYIMPLLLGGGLYLFGELKNHSKEAAGGSAALQAVMAAAAYSTLLKAFTGRPNPDPMMYENGSASNEFFFGFMRGGIHYGWPSGHLCTNTAMAASLISFYNKNIIIKIAGLGYLAYLFYGVTVHDNNTMHWFSDAAAGLLMGWAIGSTIGRNFRDKYMEAQSTASGTQAESFILPGLTAGENKTIFSLSPVFSENLRGLKFQFSF